MPDIIDQITKVIELNARINSLSNQVLLIEKDIPVKESAILDTLKEKTDALSVRDKADVAIASATAGVQAATGAVEEAKKRLGDTLALQAQTKEARATFSDTVFAAFDVLLTKLKAEKTEIEQKRDETISELASVQAESDTISASLKSKGYELNIGSSHQSRAFIL